MSISTRLYTLRVDHGYSQDDLAQIIGVSRQAISKWERAESVPDTDKLIALSELYGLTIDEILKGESEEATISGEDTSEVSGANKNNAAESVLQVESSAEVGNSGFGAGNADANKAQAEEAGAAGLESPQEIPSPAASHAFPGKSTGSIPDKGVSKDVWGSEAPTFEGPNSPSPRRRGVLVAFVAIVVLALALIIGDGLMESYEDKGGSPKFPDMEAVESTLAAYSEEVSASAQSAHAESWEIGNDAFFSGENVVVESDVAGNLFAAGQQVGGASLSVASDAFLAGETVAVAGWDVGNAIFAAGKYVLIGTGNEETHAKAVLASGKEVLVAGTFESAHLAGERVVIDGTFSGDVFVAADTVEVDDGAVINGTLHMAEDGQLIVSDNAQVAHLDAFKSLSVGSWGGETFFTVLFGLLSSVAVAALLLLILGDKPVHGTLALVQKYPVRVFVTGVIALVCTPLAGLILLVTVLGLPVAVAVMLLLVSVALLCVPFAAICLGRALFPSWNRWGSGLLAAATFALVANAPILGPVLWIVSMAFTLGCLLASYWHGRRSQGVLKG